MTAFNEEEFFDDAETSEGGDSSMLKINQEGGEDAEVQHQSLPTINAQHIAESEGESYKGLSHTYSPKSNLDVSERLELCFSNIASEISRLSKLSSTIRRVSKEASILRTSNIHLTDESGNDTESNMLELFLHFVKDMFPNLNDIIHQRLTRAMLLRRKKALYERYSPGKPVVWSQEAAPRSSVALPHIQSTVPSGFQDELKDEHEAKWLAKTATAPTLPQNKSEYATSLGKLGRSSPDRASRPENLIEPYVCLFVGCHEPDLIYSHRNEWLDHLRWHNKVWRCSSHRELDFSTRDDYFVHMREVHNTKLSDSQLRVMAKRNLRKVEKPLLSCLMCGREGTEIDGRLEDHMIVHMRALALKSVPSHDEQMIDEIEGDKKSANTWYDRDLSRIEGSDSDEDMIDIKTEKVEPAGDVPMPLWPISSPDKAQAMHQHKGASTEIGQSVSVTTELAFPSRPIGRPPFWTTSRQRKMCRLCLYTTLKMEEIIELIYIDAPSMIHYDLPLSAPR